MQEQYKYQAATSDGSIRTGTVSAHSTDNVEEFLLKQQLIPVKISVIPRRQPFSFFGLLQGTDYEQLIMFTNQLATLHRTGIPLLRSLSIIRIGKPGSRFNDAIDQIRSGVQSGQSLSEAMTPFPDLFSNVYTASVAAGEESGKLEFTLEELSLMLEREMELGRQIKVATRYPIIVLGVIALAFLVMMAFVIPRFVAFYNAFNAQLPLPTRILIATSNVITTYWPIVLGTLIGIVFLLKKIFSTEKGRRWFDKKMLKLPVFGDLVIKSNIARFTLMFRMMFKAGLPIVRSMEILVDTVKNSAISDEIRKMDELFRTGKEISVEQGQFVYFPDLALQLMSIGLESGSLETMLNEVGNHYVKEVNYRSRQLTTIIEPILTLFLGAFVLVLALAMFLPMWNLIHVLKQ